MTQELAESVKDLAKSMVEALKRIVEWECPKCKGKGYSKWIGHGSKAHGITCKICNGLGKIHYSWTPQVGEWCIWENCISLICSLHLAIEKHRITLAHIPGEQIDLDRMGSCVVVEDCMPILPWETLERVLEGVGYRVQVTKWIESGESPSLYIYECKIHKNKTHIKVIGKTRQEAVMRSVIALAKELTRT